MFRQSINLIPPFTREIKNSVGVMQEMDSSLFMTAVVLLHKRVPNLKVQSTITRTTIAGINFNEVNFNPEIYSFHWFETSINPDELLGTIKDKYDTVVSAQNIEKFINEKFGRKVYIRIFPKENTVCLFVDNMNMEIWHLLQSFMSKYFEVFKEHPLDSDEIEFARSLTLKTSTSYINRLQTLADSETFRDFALHIQLNGFERRLYERKLSAAKENVNACERSLENLMNQLRDITKKHLEAKIFFEGLAQITSAIEEKTELQEYLLANKNITDISVEENHIRFVVKTFLTPYHTDDWENMSRRGAIFSSLHGFTSEDAKLLLDAIFSEDHTLRLKVCGHVDLDYLYADVRSNTNYDYSRLKDYVPNAHLARHSCFGQNKPDIVAQLQQGDAIGAIECAINCVKHMNVNEISASFGPFLKSVMSCEGKCIVAEDGTEMTPREAIAYLKGNNNENNTTDRTDEN